MRDRLSRTRARVVRLAQIARACSKDERIPKALRWAIVAGVVAGPFILGPVDELLTIALLLVVVWKFPHVWREHAERIVR